jgi:DNA-directed RNA polymerase specialized sigma24 family protein
MTARISAMIEQLTDDQREVFELIVTDLEGYPDALVADYMGVTPAEVAAYRKAAL